MCRSSSNFAGAGFRKGGKAMEKFFRGATFAALALAVVFVPIGCGSSGSSEMSGGSSTSLSSADKEAQNAALAELQRHWQKGPDGWTTAITSGSPYAPEHFLRQYRTLTVAELQVEDLSESDKLNGFEWVGELKFKPTSCREAGAAGSPVLDGMSNVVVTRPQGRWSQWVDFTPGPMHFQKQKGRWQFQWDGSYLRGTLPGPQDFANAGVH
jgi:hypothetical protein